jgi:creatinine amidohydrolase
MQWERLNQKDFIKARSASGRFCVVPVGVLEKHGPHAAIGTDLLTVHAIACAAARKEPAVVFPGYFFSQIFEARHQIGTIAIRQDLMMEVLDNLCDEIGRNGFTKILLLNGHGGNRHFLPFFCQTQLAAKKPYAVYTASYGFERQSELKPLMDSEEDQHGGEIESSMMAYLGEDLFRQAYVPGKPSLSLGRLPNLSGAYNSIGWYSMFPDHYGGDARTATAEKGRKFFDWFTERTSETYRAVKKDRTGPQLLKEFHGRTNHG